MKPVHSEPRSAVPQGHPSVCPSVRPPHVATGLAEDWVPAGCRGDTIHLASRPIRHHLKGCTLQCGGPRQGWDAFRNGNGTHLFMIYSLTLNGNPMGPIKGLPHPASTSKVAGAGPVLRRQKVSQSRVARCTPPPALSLSFGRLLAVPEMSGAARLSRLWGRKAGGPLLLRSRRFQGGFEEATCIFWAQDRPGAGASGGGEIQFSIFLKRKTSA